MEDTESGEAKAIARRERLKAFRAAQQLFNNPDDPLPSAPLSPPAGADDTADEDGENGDEGGSELNAAGNGSKEAPLPNVKFRNYLPHAKELQEGKVAPPPPPKFDEPVYEAGPPQIDDDECDPFVNIAPKKANWDLRRDVQKRLDKLEKRTLKALCKLMEEQKKQEIESRDENGDDMDAKQG